MTTNLVLLFIFIGVLFFTTVNGLSLNGINIVQITRRPLNTLDW